MSPRCVKEGKTAPKSCTLCGEVLITMARLEIQGEMCIRDSADIDGYIVPPACGGDQGVLGAIALGAQALEG